MTEDDLIRYLNTEKDSAFQHASGALAEERSRAMRDYMRQPYGTEQDGRSQVVASDVFDAVEGMLPDLIDVFVSSDKAVVFDPVEASDEAGAEQATNACNHVFYKQNNGFLVLLTAGKDALLQKVGSIKWWWEVKRTPNFETLAFNDEMQFAMWQLSNPQSEILSREDIEPTEQETQQYQQLIQQAQQQGIPAEMIPPMPQRFSVRTKTVKERGKVTLCNIPPDELLVSRRHNSVLLDECPYVAHVSQRTLSEVQQMGFDVTLEDIKAAQNEPTTQDREYRETLRGINDRLTQENDLDPAMVRGWLLEEYVLVDYDEDGIAERRKVIRLGNKVLLNEEFSHVPIAAWTPYVVTHRFEGLSVADLVEDFQRISTDITRAQLDNLDLANNQETVVLTDAQGSPLADIDDLLNRRPGGIMRERVQGAIRPYNERWQGIEAMPMLEALQVSKENRTGWTRYSQGLDADSLNKTATGMQMIQNASQKRMKLMARIMAEALVAPTFRGIFKTLSDYCMEKLSFRLSNTFVQYDPQEWRDGYDMTINVGIGTGDVQQQAMFLQQIAQAQFAMLQTPMARLVSEANVYEVHSRIAENAGFKNPGAFFTDTKGQPPPQPQPDPKLALEQQKMQAAAAEADKQRQDAQQKFQAEMQMQMRIDQNRQEMEARQKQLELQQEAQLAAVEARFNEREAAQQMAFDKWKAELDARVKLQIAGMAQQGAREGRQLDAMKHSDARQDAAMEKQSEAADDAD